MRNRILVLFIVGCLGLCGVGRAEIIEVPLPEFVGEYERWPVKEFHIDLGFPVTDIRDVRLRVEGTAAGAFVSGPLDQGSGARDVFLQVYLEEGDALMGATGPSAGAATHPEPAPFAGEVAFRSIHPPHVPPAEWSFLEDGTARLEVWLGVAGHIDIESRVVGGSAEISAAILIVDATRVPEPGVAVVFVVGVGMLRRRRGVRVGSEA